MKFSAKKYFGLLKTAAMDWVNDHAPRLGASLAFYTIFSLAPLLTIVVAIASLWFNDNASREIFEQIGSVIGADNAKSLQDMLHQPGKEKTGILTTVSAALMLFVGATGVFVQLQDALNEIWEVRPKPGQGIMGFIRHRLLSVGAVLGIGFLLLVSLVLTAAIGAVGKHLGGTVGNLEWLWQIINTVVSIGVITALFAFMFKYLPDAKISWRDVWFGALFTAGLFTLGKFALGSYLGKSTLASTYSVAWGLIVVLLWVYYSAQILFFGAEITQAYAAMQGRNVQPSEHAEWDEAKIEQRKKEEEAQERKKQVKDSKKPIEPLPALSPAYSMGAPAGAESGSGAGPWRSGKSAKTLGGLVLLALIFVPLERKLFRAARS